MARLPDLVRDSKLETHFLSGVETVHTYHESDPTSRRRLVPRSEHWQRERKIGRGGFGSVWVEKCTKGHRNIEVRAVKQIEIDHGSARIDYNRELEAIAKFSHQKVCFISQLCPLQNLLINGSMSGVLLSHLDGTKVQNIYLLRWSTLSWVIYILTCILTHHYRNSKRKR